MSEAPQSISASEPYLGYDIAYRLIGPIDSNPHDPSDSATHFRASVTLFYQGQQVEGTLEHLHENFVDADAAKAAALSKGRVIVGQRR